MSLITSIFGTIILTKSKPEVIDFIKSSPLVSVELRARYLRDWGAATGTELTAADYKLLENEGVQ